MSFLGYVWKVLLHPITLGLFGQLFARLLQLGADTRNRNAQLAKPKADPDK